jgi:hypothetical protein
VRLLDWTTAYGDSFGLRTSWSCRSPSPCRSAVDRGQYRFVLRPNPTLPRPNRGTTWWDPPDSKPSRVHWYVCRCCCWCGYWCCVRTGRRCVRGRLRPIRQSTCRSIHRRTRPGRCDPRWTATPWFESPREASYPLTKHPTPRVTRNQL